VRHRRHTAKELRVPAHNHRRDPDGGLSIKRQDCVNLCCRSIAILSEQAPAGSAKPISVSAAEVDQMIQEVRSAAAQSRGERSEASEAGVRQVLTVWAIKAWVADTIRCPG
jgi:hypothetical protein